MQKLMTLAFGAILALPQLAAAAEVTGAEIGLSYSTLADGNARDVNKTSLGGALELSFGPQFSVQGDFAMRYFDLLDDDGQNVTLHGIYHAPNGMAAGVFFGKDWLNQDDEYMGIEASGAMGAIGYEAAFTHYDGFYSHGNQIALQGDYALNQQLSVGGRFDLLHSAGDDMGRLSATADYDLMPGTVLSGEVGFADGDGMNAEPFIGLGLKATFGEDGVTFGGRGVQEFLPGL